MYKSNFDTFTFIYVDPPAFAFTTAISPSTRHSDKQRKHSNYDTATSNQTTSTFPSAHSPFDYQNWKAWNGFWAPGLYQSTISIGLTRSVPLLSAIDPSLAIMYRHRTTSLYRLSIKTLANVSIILLLLFRKQNASSCGSSSKECHTQKMEGFPPPSSHIPTS